MRAIVFLEPEHTDRNAASADANSDFLLENGAAVKVNNIASLRFKLTAPLPEPGRLESIRAAARRLAAPCAAA